MLVESFLNTIHQMSITEDLKKKKNHHFGQRSQQANCSTMNCIQQKNAWPIGTEVNGAYIQQ